MKKKTLKNEVKDLNEIIGYQKLVIEDIEGYITVLQEEAKEYLDLISEYEKQICDLKDSYTNLLTLLEVRDDIEASFKRGFLYGRKRLSTHILNILQEEDKVSE